MKTVRIKGRVSFTYTDEDTERVDIELKVEDDATEDEIEELALSKIEDDLPYMEVDNLDFDDFNMEVISQEGGTVKDHWGDQAALLRRNHAPVLPGFEVMA